MEGTRVGVRGSKRKIRSFQGNFGQSRAAAWMGVLADKDFIRVSNAMSRAMLDYRRGLGRATHAPSLLRKSRGKKSRKLTPLEYDYVDGISLTDQVPTDYTTQPVTDPTVDPTVTVQPIEGDGPVNSKWDVDESNII